MTIRGGLALLGVFAVVLSVFVFSACSTTTTTTTKYFSRTGDQRPPHTSTDDSHLHTRKIQNRAFDTVDKRRVIQDVITTLHDEGFLLDSFDEELATVIATKLVEHRYPVAVITATNWAATVTSEYELPPYELRINVTILPLTKTQLMVRAQVQHNSNEEVDVLGIYQGFFQSLSASLSLEAHEVD